MHVVCVSMFTGDCLLGASAARRSAMVPVCFNHTCTHLPHVTPRVIT